ncbi:NADPH:quinone oxidoreductase family protein [Pusillimonas sp. NJUB218]|uniref:NADPH:quinone oxidoreductase family protein n=1 Tax=Pusillimonas sp. NJUB218 TaxID=2023230 RepID=UPI000F4CC72A|nr:NADPH:quinone oxidoreductase family protein [Pusillimonas sp. NJUB218]ROT45997.1 NADPH:quinone oxidoreductase [Pusillimonas sp. NJUB218]
MKALVCEQFGALDNLRLQSVSSPTPGPGQVVVQVHAASLNFPDVLMCQGKYQVKPPLPFSPGAEVAGVVCEVGAGVTDWQPGEAVMASTGYGALAEQCVVDAVRLARLPAGMSFAQASAMVVTYGTALHALRDCAGLQAGETVLVLGAAGGVGSAALQVARQMGARVIAAVSSEAKAALCRRQGVDAVLIYTEPAQLKSQIGALAGEGGVQVVFDPVGGNFALPAFRSLAWGGRYLVVGFAAGTIPAFPLNFALLQARRVLGVYWGEVIRRDPAAYQAVLRQLCDWVTAGLIAPVISAEIGLEQAVEGLKAIEARQVTGKVVVKFTDTD